MLCRYTCIPDGHLHTVTYARFIGIIDSPDDEHIVARNLYRDARSREQNFSEQFVLNEIICEFLA